MSRIYVLHENDEWVAPLQDAFERQGHPHTFWHLASGTFDLGNEPPQGVFYNRMSASSHTRDHRFAPEYTAALVEWLESHGREVINGSRALDLEISKARQYAALQRAGVRVPRTVVVHNSDLLHSASLFGYPLILKPNRGGKGLGVQRVDSEDDLSRLLSNDAVEFGPDGLVLIQQLIESAEPFIIRNEFVGGHHLYSVKVSTDSGFELCPADVCDIERDQSPESEFCPADSTTATFNILDGYSPPDLTAYAKTLRDNSIQVAGIELILDRDGVAWTYDLNTNTNYNPGAEERAGLAQTDGAGMDALARHLGARLRANQVCQRQVA